MTKIANGAAYFFVFTSFALTVVAVGGIWGLFAGDVIEKSFESIGLIAFACIIVLVANGFATKKILSPSDVVENNRSVEGFKVLRSIGVTVLIVSVTVCVFLGLLSIWEVVVGEVLYKSIATMATVGFYALITALVSSKRINDMKGDPKTPVSPVLSQNHVDTPVIPQVPNSPIGTTIPEGVTSQSTSAAPES